MTARVGERSVRELGYFSIGLGALEISTPGVVARAMGLRVGGISDWILRGFRVREITAGIGALGQRRPSQWLWARVVRNALELLFAASRLLSPHGECELIDRSHWRTHTEARMAVFDYIECFYNFMAPSLCARLPQLCGSSKREPSYTLLPPNVTSPPKRRNSSVQLQTSLDVPT